MQDIKITPEDSPLVSQIVSGLLASGHFTFPSPDPEVIMADNGPDWRSDGFQKRWTSFVVEQAIEILKEIKFGCQHDADS